MLGNLPVDEKEIWNDRKEVLSGNADPNMARIVTSYNEVLREIGDY